jgi:uncharacterized membrane protein YkoI
MKANITNIIQQSLLSCVIAIFISGSAFADSDHNKARKLKEAGEILPLEVIIANARKQLSGHILEIELEFEDDRYVYELEMLDDSGTIWELDYDAQSGKLIKKKVDD